MAGLKRSSLCAAAFALSTFLSACGGPSKVAAPAPTPEPPALQPENDDLLVHDGLPPQAFRGDDGVAVEIVYLRDHEGVSRALIRATGANDPVAGITLLATRNGTGANHQWMVHFDGRERPFLQVIAKQRSGLAHLEVSLVFPRLQAPFRVNYDADASKAIDVENLVAAHRAQRAEGVLARLARPDREYHIARIKKSLSITSANIERDCGKTIPLEIDWSSYSDEELVLTNYCPDSMDTARDICRRDTASHKTFLRDVQRIQCSNGKTSTMRVKDGVLRLTQPPATGWRGREAFEVLSKELALTDTVVRDADGRVLRFSPDTTTKVIPMYLGDGKTMRRLARDKRMANTEAWAPIRGTALRHTPEGWVTKCLDREISFLPVDDKTRMAVLNDATYIDEPLWKRREFALARDDRGNYYYVDSYSDEFGGQNFRVFRGPRGNVRQTTLTDIVDDSGGMIFATKEGKLRLVLGNGGETDVEETAAWIEGKKRIKLVMLPLYTNGKLIYTGLGAYDGETFGTICD